MVTSVDGKRYWWPHVGEVSRVLNQEFPGIISLTTYLGHGIYPGEKGAASAIDIQVAPWGLEANNQQEVVGDRIQKWLEANWVAANIDYVIWWNFIAFAPGVWKPYDYRKYWVQGSSVNTLKHMDHLHVTFQQPPRVVGDLTSAEGDDMAWEKVILAHAGFEDGQLCGDAYKVLMANNIQASIANSDNIGRANAFCWPRPVGSNEFLVVGQGAREALPAEARRVIGQPREQSDYRDCVGEDLAQTRQKLAVALDGIAEGLGESFLAETA